MSTYSWVYSHLYECLYCETCDKLCIERFYKNYLKSQTHKNNIRKIENSIIFNSTLTEPKQ